MARKKTDIEMAKAIATKRLRSRVRLESSVLADTVLNEVLDEFSREFDRRVAMGEPYELDNYDEFVMRSIAAAIRLYAAQNRFWSV